LISCSTTVEATEFFPTSRGTVESNCGRTPDAVAARATRLRNAIAHDYLIESADRVLTEALAASPELTDAVQRVVRYVETKRYC
jgi:hypothetical protein